MDLKIFLFDTKGTDKQLDFEELSGKKISDKQLLWVDISKRDRETIAKTTEALSLQNFPLEKVLRDHERPKIDIYKDFFRFSIVSVMTAKNDRIKAIPLDFVVGRNFVLTIHDGEVGYFKEFTELEKGETHIAELDAESFVAALLNLHIVSYFCVLEAIEEKVDEFDETVLQKEIETEDFLAEMVKLRREVSKLRRWFLPHRDVFYALSRPDFQRIAKSDSAENFKMLNDHFENAVDAIESSRDTVLSLFELYATKSAQLMNKFIQRLTFITLLVGGLGAVAGIWGMNFEVGYFKAAEYGFWLTIGSMVLLSIILTIVAKFKKWI
jgi:magnesium/cobalt transport protein CorA